MEGLKKIFAGKLLGIRAIRLQPNDPFAWASGWKSSFYCDNRKVLSFHDVCSFVELELVHATLKNFSEAIAVAGITTGVIAQGMLVANKLALSYAYVCPKPRNHGMKNQIESGLPAGSKVVVVEDLISTGDSPLKAVTTLHEAGLEVVGMVASYTYGLPVAEGTSRKANVRLVTFTDHEHVTEETLETGYIKESEISMLHDQRKDPVNWRE